ncbi:BamA/TamA family outer membrane protein [Anditalea andensis]|nr:BamA/TamA family outer membrane protein [Anditalea andensis]
MILLFISVPCLCQESLYYLNYGVPGNMDNRGLLIFRDSLSREQMLNTIIEDFYLEGYLQVSIKQREFYGDSLSVSIDSGELYSWGALKPGNVPPQIIAKSGLNLNLFTGRPFSYRKLTDLYEGLIRVLEDNGYPFASLKLEDMVQDGNQISAALHCDMGPFITFDTIRLVGNGSKTDPVFLSRILHIAPGTPFSQKRINESIASIRNLPYIKMVGVPEITFQNNEATLHLSLLDKKINVLDGVIGFLPHDNGGKWLVTGQFDLALYNIAGKGRNYGIAWRRWNPYSQSIRLTAEEPFILGSYIDVKASLFILKEDTSFVNRDFRLDLGYRLSPLAYFSFVNRRQAGDLFAVSEYDKTGNFPNLADFRYNNYGFRINLNCLDDLIFPRRGWFSLLDFAIGNKKILQNVGLPDTFYNGIKLNEVQYYITVRSSKYIFLSQKLAIMTGLNAGKIEGGNLLWNDLYRLGGLKSIRGFNENFFFANKYIYTNIEPRFYFDNYSYLLIFADMGNITNKFSSRINERPYSFGSGLNMETAGGMLQFIYAVGHSGAQPLALNYSRIHVGYTGRF